MVARPAPDDADRAVALLAGHGVDAWVCGEVSAATAAGGDPAGGSVTLRGQHPGW
jgi:phosphoribosylformylglycinamidine cyclo-ligase